MSRTIYGNSVDAVNSVEAQLRGEENAAAYWRANQAYQNARLADSYAFQRRGIQAAEEAQAANYFNQFNRDLAANRMQQDREREAAGERRFQFGVNRDLADREFGLRKDEFAFRKEAANRQDQQEQDVVDNRGVTLAESLAAVAPIKNQAQIALDEARRKMSALVANAAKQNLAVSEKGFTGVSEVLPNFNERFRLYQQELKDAQIADREAERAALDVERQARANGFVIENGALRHLRTAKSYDFSRPAARQAPAQPVSAGTPPRPTASTTPPTTPSADIIKWVNGVPTRNGVRIDLVTGRPVATSQTPPDDRGDTTRALTPQPAIEPAPTARVSEMTGPSMDDAPLAVVEEQYRNRLRAIRDINAGRGGGARISSEVPGTTFGIPRSPRTESLTDPIASELAAILRITPAQVGQSIVYRTAVAQAEDILKSTYGDAVWAELSEDEQRRILLAALRNSQRDPYSRPNSSVGYEFKR